MKGNSVQVNSTRVQTERKTTQKHFIYRLTLIKDFENFSAHAVHQKLLSLAAFEASKENVSQGQRS